MSLIDEALKKVSEEAARHAALSQGAPIPYATARGAERRRFRRGFGIGIGAGLLLALLAIVAILLRPAARRVPSASALAVPREKSTLPPVTEEVVVPPPAGEKPPVATRAPGPVPATAPSAPVHSTSPPARPAAAPARSSGPPAHSTALPAAGPAPKSAGGPVSGRSYPAKLDLPDGLAIELDGIVYSDTKPVALINGHVLVAGDFVYDFRIVKIEREHITLEGRGATFTMTMH